MSVYVNALIFIKDITLLTAVYRATSRYYQSPTSPEVKEVWIYKPTPPYTIME
jgi:hypothetical protein